MQISKCLGCGGVDFELTAPMPVLGSLSEHTFIQCASCGGVVGVAHDMSMDAVVSQIERNFKDLMQKVKHIESKIS